MHFWQLERQLRSRLKLAVWADPPGDLILSGGAFVSKDGLANFLTGAFTVEPDGSAGPPRAPALPYAVVEVLRAEEQAEPRGRTFPRAKVWVVAGGKGISGGPANVDNVDTHGELALTGGGRDNSGGGLTGQGHSKGRSADEVVEALVAQAFAGGETQDSVHGFQGRVLSTDEVVPVDGVQTVARAIEIEVYTGTATRFYHRAWALKATGAAGQVSLAWKLPPSRFDTGAGTQVLRRSVAGGPVPSSPTDGASVNVPIAPGQTAVVVGGLAAGVYQFALWTGYDETGSGGVERYSDPAVASGTAA